MLNPQYERLILDPASDTLRVMLPSGMEVAFELSPAQMSALSRWSFARKIFHIIMGARQVEPFAPITH
jgi:hypothetical protein